MKRFQLVALLVAASYAAIVLGVNFHTHTIGHDQIGIYCKLCQVSQISLEHSSAQSFVPDETIIQNQPDSVVNFIRDERIQDFNGRSPPVC